MNVLFLFIGSFDNIDQHEIYPDLVRKFSAEGNKAYVVCSNERREKQPTELLCQKGVSILKVQIGNITKTNTIEKGISTILIEKQYKSAIKKYFSQVKFDVVIYATPPITLEKVVKYIKKRDGAKSYLMLKDIFPQNALDLSMLSTKGIKGILYRYFRYKEKRLYKISDYIGCMSEANCKYLKEHNPEVAPEIVEICPNCFDVHELMVDVDEKNILFEKYQLPKNKILLVYGGNLGKPQGISFLLECLLSQKNNDEIFFLIVGGGTEYDWLNKEIGENNLTNVRLINRVPTCDYEQLVAICDVGLVFLDYRFSIPNFPSRMLSYMQAKIPVLACTDVNTDIGKVIQENGYGWWCESNDVNAFSRIINCLSSTDLKEMGQRAFETLEELYNINVAYNVIMSHIEK